MTICALLPLSALYGRAGEDDIRNADTEDVSAAKLLYMGHASIRITTTEGKVIYMIESPKVGNSRLDEYKVFAP